MMRGLFGKKMQMSGMGAGYAGMGGGIVATPEQEAESARLAAMFPNAGMPRDEITYTPQAQAIMSGEAPMPAKQGFDWKNVLLQTLGGAADGAATFFGGEPVIRQNMQMQQKMAMVNAERQRQRAEELADYRTKLGIQQEFEQPEAPKPGSFEWYNSPTTTDAERAAYDRYNPVVATTWQGPTIIPRASFGRQSGPQVGAVEDGYRFKGGDPSNPASWEPVDGAQPTAQQQPMVPFTREQYEGLVQARGNRAWVDNWMRQNGIRVVN